MFLAQKKGLRGSHALKKHCSRGADSGGMERGVNSGIGMGGKKYHRLQTNGEGGKWIQTLAFKNYKHSLVHKMLYGNCV